MPKRKSAAPKVVNRQKRQREEPKKTQEEEVVYERQPRDSVPDHAPGTAISIANEEPDAIILVSDTLGSHVSEGVRDKIKNGEFIHLGVLLDNSPQNQTLVSAKLVIVNGELVS